MKIKNQVVVYSSTKSTVTSYSCTKSTITDVYSTSQVVRSNANTVQLYQSYWVENAAVVGLLHKKNFKFQIKFCLKIETLKFPN